MVGILISLYRPFCMLIYAALQACEHEDCGEITHSISPKVRCPSRATVSRELLRMEIKKIRLNARFVRRYKTYFSSRIRFIYVSNSEGGAMLRNVNLRPGLKVYLGLPQPSPATFLVDGFLFSKAPI